VARLTFDSLGESLIVLEGANGTALAFGPGRMINSVYPNNSNTVIAGHRDTHFADLKAVKVGQLLTYQSSDGSVQSFEVIDTRIVHETQTGVLEPTTEPTLTLITCYPFDAIAPGGPLRYVVRAQLDVPDYSLSSSARLARGFKEALEMSSRAQF
jgi:sortase A